ncbi:MULTISPECIES: tetratricopeptide repeat protein [Actinoplanes]|uniref:tetratricopeptide repeat protein n=1 Tax=Actinoplanes TaxID=1865 RepID=UPI0005F2C3D1|nr:MULTISPECIES: tetratricopeptide repeat protein [Actinoplanes]GLY00542.1 hypothetical protein Acsp01_09210 [Actinoplanes sp. NBRC 101535]
MRTEPVLAEADALLARGRARSAETLLAPFVGREPANLGAWHRMARARLDLGDPRGALTAARAARQLDPAGAETLYWASLAASELGEHPDAITAAAGACHADPGNPRLHQRLAEAQLAAGLAAEAADGLRIAVELAGYDADLHVTYGAALFAVGRPLSAREALLRALTVDPANTQAATALAFQQKVMRGATDAKTMAAIADDYAASLRIPPGGRPPVRTERAALRHVARIAFFWLVAALAVAGLAESAGLASPPDALYTALFCAAAAVCCVATLARPSRL